MIDGKWGILLYKMIVVIFLLRGLNICFKSLVKKNNIIFKKCCLFEICDVFYVFYVVLLIF